MVSTPSPLGQVVGIVTFVVALLAPGVVATVCWTPFLAAKRIRTLLETLPPTRSLLPTYLLVGVGGSIPYVAGFLAILTSDAPPEHGMLSARLLTMTLLLGVSYTIVPPLVGVHGLPRAGIDWDTTDYGASTWALLAAGGAWYATLFGVPLVGLSLVFVLPGGY